MDWYLAWVKADPMWSAAVQFGVLGTLGELLSAYLRERRWSLGCSWAQFAGKVLAWALLGVVIKYGFVGMRGFVGALLEHGLLPACLADGLGSAVAVSVATNVLFGPQMMYFHRLEENLVMRRWDWSGLDRALRTLVWFWIPAHTVTFSLPRDYQIGLAALWSLALGLILGLAAPKRATEQ